MTTPTPVRLLLDTSFCLYLIQARAVHLEAQFAHFAPGEIAVSALTAAVLERMAQLSSHPERNRQALAQFLLPLVVLEFEHADASELGRMGALDAGVGAGAESETHALLLAAQARRRNAVLVTTRPELYANFSGVRWQLGVQEEIPAALPVRADTPRGPAPRTIRIAGSHDLSLALLGDFLHAEHPELTLTASPVGSLPGLLALLHHDAHLAGTHLFDEETGDFNVGPIRRLLAAHGLHVLLVGFVNRVQGLIVPRGNPKDICSLGDLARPDVVFINRQPGAGTRVLLDFHLRRAGVSVHAIRGYDRHETTHLAVATAVAQGSADCGLGIQAAAQALALDFVPLFDERFDLAVPVELYESALLAPLFALLRRAQSPFRQRVAALGGYGTEVMGHVLAEV
jgi:molybdate-binding protein/predicted nucleic acid-binding protein